MAPSSESLLRPSQKQSFTIDPVNIPLPEPDQQEREFSSLPNIYEPSPFGSLRGAESEIEHEDTPEPEDRSTVRRSAPRPESPVAVVADEESEIEQIVPDKIELHSHLLRPVSRLKNEDSIFPPWALSKSKSSGKYPYGSGQL